MGNFTTELHYMAGSVRLARFPMGTEDPLQDGPVPLVHELHRTLPGRHRAELLKGVTIEVTHFIGMSVIERGERDIERVRSFAFVTDPRNHMRIEPIDDTQLLGLSSKRVSALRRPGEKLGVPGRLVHLRLSPNDQARPLIADTAIRATAIPKPIGTLPHVLIHRSLQNGLPTIIETMLTFNEIEV
jgi:hypothetical protein